MLTHTYTKSQKLTWKPAERAQIFPCKLAIAASFTFPWNEDNNDHELSSFSFGLLPKTYGTKQMLVYIDLPRHGESKCGRQETMQKTKKKRRARALSKWKQKNATISDPCATKYIALFHSFIYYWYRYVYRINKQMDGKSIHFFLVLQVYTVDRKQANTKKTTRNKKKRA